MELEEIVKRVTLALYTKGLTIATAEECTCGLIGAALGSEDFAHKWYKGTLTTYTANDIANVVGVPWSVIGKNDVVSCQVAQHMALNVLYKFGVGISIGVVGYVDGYGSTDVAGGTVQICIARRSIGEAIAFKYMKLNLEGSDRGKNVEKIMKECLLATLSHIMGE